MCQQITIDRKGGKNFYRDIRQMTRKEWFGWGPSRAVGSPRPSHASVPLECPAKIAESGGHSLLLVARTTTCCHTTEVVGQNLLKHFG